jgi:uncharacterized membrane protein YeaQ/YmgE (transglycosylase-associated protein family)
MNIITWILFGALAGWVASKLVGTDARQGAVGNIIVGIIGAFIGGYLMQLLGESGVTGFNIRSFVVAVIGSVVLLVIYKSLRH